MKKRTAVTDPWPSAACSLVFLSLPGVEAGPLHNFQLTIILVLSLLLAAAAIGLTAVFYRMRKKIQRQLENHQTLNRMFINSFENLIYLKDANLRYVIANEAFARYDGREVKDFIGHTDMELTDPYYAEIRERTDREALAAGHPVTSQVTRRGRLFTATKFPVVLPDGSTGVGGHITDITDFYSQQESLRKTMERHKILVEVLSRSFRSRQEQLDYVLHQALTLTGSRYGYIYLYDEDRKELVLNSWTRGVMDECAVENPPAVYPLEKTGVWGEAVRQRKPIVMNDFQAPHPQKRGFPEGHIQLKRFLTIPVVIEDRIVAVVGMADKEKDYDENDLYELTLLMAGVWNAVERREAQVRLALERNKYLQTLISIGDGVMVVDREGRIEVLNTVARKLTGWGDEAVGRPYREVWQLSSEDPAEPVADPVERVLSTDQVQVLGNHALLVSRQGEVYHLEDSAAPVRDESGRTVGVVLVFRDVTEKREQKRQIEFLSFHDSLTGLYNRRFFEEEMRRLDTPRNLPLTVIMGDINSLKLTNDVFGHNSGDTLLTRAAEVFRRVCRKDDIIARWGGDEFVLLLPKTGEAEAAQILARIRNEYAKERIEAFHGSISMGSDTKYNESEDLLKCLTLAEERMYQSKALEKDKIKNDAITAVLRALEEKSPREMDHAAKVRDLSVVLGRKLGLPEDELRKLKDAAYMHDLGKIALSKPLMDKITGFTPEEWKEVRRHPVVGYRILNSFDDTLDLAEIVLAHQEHWDGSGYPKGLKGEEIPRLSQIIAITESYERRLHDAAGFKSLSRAEAIQAIRERSGSQFDPILTGQFLQMLSEME